MDKNKKFNKWLIISWKPMMGWSYMVTCIFDFIIAPVLWSIVQVYFKGDVQSQWSPLTLEGAGLFHISMGAILGVSAYASSDRSYRRIGESRYDRRYEKSHENSRYRDKYGTATFTKRRANE